jgi:plasmid stabilization system protein ParE
MDQESEKYSLKFSPTAEQDLEKIYSYISESLLAPTAADKKIFNPRNIEQTFLSLSVRLEIFDFVSRTYAKLSETRNL